MRPKFYVPACMRSFQGFIVKDIKDRVQERRVEVYLEQGANSLRKCHKCFSKLGSYHDSHCITAKHLKMMGWQVEVIFHREKRFCPNCKKVRSQHIPWLSPSSPHVTLDLAWRLNRLSEVTSVLSVSKLESLDKSTCYH